MDFYNALDLPENATDTDIKKAYRKLALKYHPDKNKEPGAEKKFKDISYAYQILSDPEQRRKYDRERHLQTPSSFTQPQHQPYHNTPFNQHQQQQQQPRRHPPTHHYFSTNEMYSDFLFQDPMDIFAQFFGGHDPFAEFFGSMESRPTSGMMMNMSNFGSVGGGGGTSSKSVSTTCVNGIKTTVTTIHDENGTQTIEDHGNGKRRVIVNGVETQNTLLDAGPKRGGDGAQTINNINKTSLLNNNQQKIQPPPPKPSQQQQQQQPQSSTSYSPQQSPNQSSPPSRYQQESPNRKDSLLKLFCCPCC